ncbi:MAG: transposase, partial [Acinetobacter sp.]
VRRLYLRNALSSSGTRRILPFPQKHSPLASTGGGPISHVNSKSPWLNALCNLMLVWHCWRNAYLLKQWDALNLYCSNGWAEIDNNIAENALRGVALGRKNWLFAGSDSGGERAAILYSLIGTCRINNVDPEAWLRYVIGHIQDWPVNRVRDLLPWKIDLTAE